MMNPAQADALDEWARARTDAGQAAAIVVAHIDGADTRVAGYGHRTWPDGPGPDGDTRFQIGSVTKVFTHLLLAERVAAGELRYEDTLATLLPDDLHPHNPGLRDIDLLSIASHRSGLPRLPSNLAMSDPGDPYAGYDEAALWAGIEQTRAGQPLGRYYGYSNLGAGLLGHLLARQIGSDYYTALNAWVMEPLRLNDTGRAPGEHAAGAFSGGRPVQPWSNDGVLIAAAGGLWGSGNDLARLVQAYLGHHPHALRHDLREDLAIVADAGEMAVTRVWHAAWAGEQPIYWHNGSTMNFWSFVGFRPDTGQGIVVLTSGDADPTALALAALGHTPRTAAAQAIDTRLAGQYDINEHFGIGIWEQRGQLQAQATGQAALALHPVGDGWYALHEVDASLRFLANDEGVIDRVQLAQNGIIQNARRSADVAQARQRTEIELTPEQQAQYEGRYAFAPGMEFIIRRGDAGLEAMLTGQSFLPIHASGNDRFFYRAVDASLQFGRDEAGRIDAVTLHQGSIEQRAPRVATEE